MKKSLYVILLITMMPTLVFAHPGRTDSSGCHYCRTNCAKYGLSNGEYHCHNGSSSSNDSSNIAPDNDSNSSYNTITNNDSNSNSNTTTNNGSNNSSNTMTNNDSNNSSNIEIDTSQQEEIKSSNNTLKEIIIDDKSFDMTDYIEYSTTKEKVSIKATTNDEKATYEIKNNSILSIGENIITIEVKAEDGTIRIYNIKVIRERILSSDIGLKVIIDDEEVKFDNYKAIVYVSSTATNINFDYALNDEKSRIEMDKLDTLKTGDNELKIKVIAEDGTEQIYEITIHKYSHAEGIISVIISFVLLGSIGYGIYFVIKRR